MKKLKAVEVLQGMGRNPEQLENISIFTACVGSHCVDGLARGNMRKVFANLRNHFNVGPDDYFEAWYVKLAKAKVEKDEDGYDAVVDKDENQWDLSWVNDGLKKKSKKLVEEGSFVYQI